MRSTTGVLFVCTGNICRSPLAEAVLRDELERRGAGDRFHVDSAGTDAYHVGERADRRMRSVAAQHGVRVESRSRRVRADDLTRFDHIFAMDSGHLRSLHRFSRDGADGEKIALFRDHDPETSDAHFPDVPDPWYGGHEDFELVYRIVARTCGKIADALLEESDD